MDISGLLHSQIGYDIREDKRALIRSTNPNYVAEGTVFIIQNIGTSEYVMQGNVKKWGDAWKSTWWEIDFSEIETEGEYQIVIVNEGSELQRSGSFKVGKNLLWNETAVPVALDQLEERARLARNGIGWKDCGSYWREANSHATMVIGLCDMLNLGFEWLDKKDVDRLIKQIIVGCDYLAVCQDKARRMKYPAGAIIHEIPNHLSIIVGDTAQGVVSFAKASRLIADVLPEKSEEYINRAVLAFEYMIHKAKPHDNSGFDRWNHGAPEDFVLPKDMMTRDLMMTLWGGVELWIAGRPEYQEDAARLAREIMARQVPEEKKEGEYYGHFYTFKNCDFTEKASAHFHFGHDTGATFPHYMMPFFEMAGRWYDHPDMALWRKAISNFGYGYFLPACKKNPFYLIPQGYYKNEGLLSFCGPFHGINTTIGYASVLATKLETFTGDPEFRKIAVGNMQWITGLNAGITQESFRGTKVWKEDIEPGKAEPYSQIVGIGKKHVGSWTKIKGTIPNGFNVNPQFKLAVKPSADADGPWMYTDEDWIPHAAGWISALTYLRDKWRYDDQVSE